MPRLRLANKSTSRHREFLRVALAMCGLLLVTACHAPHSGPATTSNAATNQDASPPPPPALTQPSAKIPPMSLQTPVSPEDAKLREVVKLDGQGQSDAALTAVNALLQANPRNLSAYSLRGEIYSKKKQWELAEKDYEAILKIDNKNIPARFNQSELKFMQKAYDDARPGFVALEADRDWGDLAAYRIYLCDLFGGHAETAQAELDAFNKTGGNPSFYFANAAWHFYNKQPDEGQAWLNTGKRIYAPWKASLYASSLEELGYVVAAAKPN